MELQRKIHAFWFILLFLSGSDWDRYHVMEDLRELA